VQDWLQRFRGDKVILNYLDKLKEIEKEVFDEENPRIEHLICENIPEGLNEETYIKVYRK